MDHSGCPDWRERAMLGLTMDHSGCPDWRERAMLLAC